ncbi:tagaturonate reductase [Mucilaginibacter sp. RS28]|uniref:Tagaturonate reductase n=1 Tax=Mucilaginibacter straminoryzae TaxID=2932774 RepID=A0A9X1X2U7_9SPHI|nr:tagaturonate reductase [Mucilaginibacter straminoryzae]MCJ8208513.1 tagaturonate reductase [Mucilaginibacter straminoryzae]
MILSRYNLKKINQPGLIVPADNIFDLPEKVLQFGTGVLLRGLPDYFIDKANREGKFNGRVAVVKSTDTGSATDFDRQDNLYTLYIKGIENGQEVNEQIICSAISRVLSAGQDWAGILKIAHNPNLQVVISNTTEVGIQLVQDDIRKHPPVSFPGKLLAILYERYKAFQGSDKCGLVIVPTELIVDNGKKLEAIVLELAHLNKLEPAFMDWLESSNHFCNSLVDRIVPGKPQAEQLAALEETSGYQDDLRTVSEAYALWAIEGNDHIKSVLSFAESHPGVIITPNIEMFRELKLRLLNGTHTLTCAIAFLSGFETVYKAMENESFLQFIKQLMLNEIAPAIPYEVDMDTAADFTNKVLDRFRNPNIEHQWISISAQYSSKLKMRVIPLLLNHYQHSQAVPDYFAFGFAAFIRFMKIAKNAEGKFAGNNNGVTYIVTDANADIFAQAWQSNDAKTVVETIFRNTTLWDTDLTQLPGFKDAVIKRLETIIYSGTLRVLENIHVKSLAR